MSSRFANLRNVAIVVPVLTGALALARCASAPAAQTNGSSDAQADMAAPKPRDASTDRKTGDTGVPEVEPGWKWFSAFGPSCPDYMVPLDPVAQMPKLEWRPCAATPYTTGTSCAEWDTSSWSVDGGPPEGYVYVRDEGTLIIARGRESTPDIFDEERDFYNIRTLAPETAIRYRHPGGGPTAYLPCQMEPVLRGFGAPTLFVFRPSFAFVSGTYAEITSATSFSEFAPAYTPAKDIASDITSSTSTLAFTSFGGIVRMKLSDKTWVRAARYLTVPLVIGDDVLADDEVAGWSGISRVEADGAVTVVRAPAQHQLRAPTYDGTYVYWTEQFGDPDPRKLQPHFELWRTLYTRDVAAFNANAERIIAVDGQFGFGVNIIFNGVFVAASPKTALVVRLSDKRVKTFTLKTLPDNQSWPFYVDQNDLWVRSQIERPADVHYQKIGIDW
jgi:hypothetical protein